MHPAAASLIGSDKHARHQLMRVSQTQNQIQCSDGRIRKGDRGNQASVLGYCAFFPKHCQHDALTSIETLEGFSHCSRQSAKGSATHSLPSEATC
eukprot:scaffold69373_cov18-Prasinocladus_malaysianus.AAC.1